MFWSLFGVTLTLGLGYTVSETLGYIKSESADGSNNTQEKALKAWQLANRITLGLTATGVIATGVVAFFTNFDGPLDETAAIKDVSGSSEKGKADTTSKDDVPNRFSHIRLLPSIDSIGSAGLVIQGAF